MASKKDYEAVTDRFGNVTEYKHKETGESISVSAYGELPDTDSEVPAPGGDTGNGNSATVAALGTTNGGSLIQTQVADMLVQPLQAASVVLSSEPVMFNSSEPLRIPTLNAPFDTDWVGENERIPEATNTFGEITLMPTERKSIKTIVRVSNELIRMAKRGVSEALQARLIEDVRTKLDTALLTGDGADNSVTGILNQPGTLKGTFDKSDPDTILDGLALMAAEEVTPNRVFLNGQDFFALRKVKDKQGRAILQPDVTADAVYRLHGVPASVSNKVPAGTAILADMSKVAVVRDLDPDITILTERYAEYDQTGIRVRARYDLGLLNGSAVAILEG